MTQLGLESIKGSKLQEEWAPGAKVWNTLMLEYCCNADTKTFRLTLEPLFRTTQTCSTSTEFMALPS